MTRATREGVELVRCPLTAKVAVHRRGDPPAVDALELAWFAARTVQERNGVVMLHLGGLTPGRIP